MLRLEKECGPRCRSRSHAGQLNIAISKGNLRQVQIFLSLCHNATSISDHFGRSVLHIAASCGKTAIVEWLLCERKMDTSNKDMDSGWTALHRALFYGQLASARLLIASGASTGLRDKEGLTPLDITMKDRLPHVSFDKSGLQEAYTWGDNANFTLGHENEQRKRFPERLELFSKNSISIKQVVMCKYHSVIVTTAGQVYTCGHGRGGRLGHGHEQTILVPKIIESIKHEVCNQASGATDHNVLLMESGSVFSFGLNTYHQLGQQPPPANCLTPKHINSKVLKDRSIIGVLAKRFHTVIYTSDAVFTFGLNAGQLGHQQVPGEKTVSQPRQVSAFNHKDLHIKMVGASDAATVVATEKGDIYVLHEYQCRKIASKWLDCADIVVSGGHLDHSTEMESLRERGGSELIILLLNSSGKVYMWRGSDPVLHRMSWTIRRSLHVTHLALSTTNMIFCTSEGEAFTATIPRAKAKEAHVHQGKDQLGTSPPQTDTFHLTLSDLVNAEDAVDVKVERVFGVHRATAVAADRKGTNFAVLQSQPNACMTELPLASSSDMLKHMEVLYAEADVTDAIHDCVLQVGKEQLPAHAYILTYKSDFFRKHFCETSSDVEAIHGEAVINIDNVDLDIFKQLLKFLYTDGCELLTVGYKWETKPEKQSNAGQSHESDEGFSDFIEVSSAEKKRSAFEVHQKKKKKGKKSNTEAVGEKDGKPAEINAHKTLLEMAKRFGVKNLVTRLEAVKLVGCVVTNIPGKHHSQPKPRWDRNKFKNLYNLQVLCEDGVVLPCHKCVLVARLEYFHSMLATGWVESSSTEALPLPVPSDILNVVLNYLYTDELAGTKVFGDVELLCNVLVVADQMLITRLKELCEVHIATQVSLKNACELLEFASMYQAAQLKATCQQFITIHLAALLEARSLDLLSEDVIDELSKAYKNMVPGMDRRIITPYEGYPEIDFLEALESAHPECPDPEQEISKEEGSGKKGMKARKRRNRLRSTGEDMPETSSAEPWCQRAERQVSVSSDTGFVMELDDLSDHESESSLQSPRILESEGVSPILKPPVSATQQINIRTTFNKAPSTAWGVGQPSVGVTVMQPLSSVQRLTSPRTVQPKGSVSQPNVSMCNSTSPVIGLRDIMEQESSKAKGQEQTQYKTPSKKSGKLSQREKKRLKSSEAMSVDGLQATSPTSTGVVIKSAWDNSSSPWGASNALVQSFKDLVLQQEEVEKLVVAKQPSKAETIPAPKMATSPMQKATLSWGLPVSGQKKSPSKVPSSPSSPKENPWSPKVSVETTGVARPLIKTVSFTEIVEDEKQQHVTLERATNKPLHLIQIEEQAIQELLVTYQASASFDETITVERVPRQLAKPTWEATQRQARHTLPYS